jgi:hypothetical protein
VRFAHELISNESHIDLSRHCQILSVAGSTRLNQQTVFLPGGTAWAFPGTQRRGQPRISEVLYRIQERRRGKLPALGKR